MVDFQHFKGSKYDPVFNKNSADLVAIHFKETSQDHMNPPKDAPADLAEAFSPSKWTHCVHVMKIYFDQLTVSKVLIKKA